MDRFVWVDEDAESMDICCSYLLCPSCRALRHSTFLCERLPTPVHFGKVLVLKAVRYGGFGNIASLLSTSHQQESLAHRFN